MSATSQSAISARRGNRKVFTVLALAGALFGAVLSPASAGAANGGVLFGATPPANGGNVDSLNRFEADLGEDLDLVRVFMRWDEAARGRRYHQEILDGGRTMLISVRAARMNGTKLSWNSIANAQSGSQIYNEIVAWADYFKTLDGERVWFVFNHEPEIGVNERQGSSGEFRSAYRQVHQIFNQRGARNVQFGWIMSNYSYELQQKAPWDRRAAAKWYPGDDVVDLIGSDPYDWSNCRTNNAVVNRPMGDLLQYFNTFAKAHPSKGLLYRRVGRNAQPELRNPSRLHQSDQGTGEAAGMGSNCGDLLLRQERSRLSQLHMGPSRQRGVHGRAALHGPRPPFQRCCSRRYLRWKGFTRR